jgi:hypothetical protein
MPQMFPTWNGGQRNIGIEIFAPTGDNTKKPSMCNVYVWWWMGCKNWMMGLMSL